MDTNNAPIQFRRIFHPSDFSDASSVAFAHALKLAVTARAHLTILHTGNTRKGVSWAEFPRVRRTLENWKLLPPGSAVDDLANLGLDVEKVVLPYRDAGRAIVRYLHKRPHDCIVLATHQYTGIERWIHEPVAGTIARESAELALFLPLKSEGFVSAADGSAKLSNILIPVDASPSPQASVDCAVALGEMLGSRQAQATLLHVGKTESFPACILPETPALQWKTVSSQGRVDQEILKAAENCSADLVVMSTQGHQGFLDALRGSTTERVIRNANCPVLAVPMYSERQPVISLAEGLATGKLTVSV